MNQRLKEKRAYDLAKAMKTEWKSQIANKVLELPNGSNLDSLNTRDLWILVGKTKAADFIAGDR